MTSAKHRTRQYQVNADLRRAQVKAAHRAGEAVACWRGGGPIHPGQPFDIGHRSPTGGEGLDNLWPEHRHEAAGCCDGNRRDGGRLGLAMRRAGKGGVTAWKL